MRRQQANRYARWAAIVASLVAVVVLTVYVRRSLEAHEVHKKAPPPVPATVERTSEGFIYSNTTGTGTLFTLRASNMTAYKESDRSLMSDVWITVYGKKGDRNDNIHTHSCDYLPASGTVFCGGEVKMDLESADEAKRVAAAPSGSEVAPKIVHITTSGVTFTKSTGETVTDKPVQFQFPGGEGRAVGAHYESGDGVLDLLHDVHMKLTPLPPKGSIPKSPPLPVDVDGSSLNFQRHAQVMFLRGPVVARQQGGPTPAQGTHEERELHASLLTVNFDHDLHADKLTATGEPNVRPQLSGAGSKGNGVIVADQFIADLAPAGWMKHLSAIGNVLGDYKTSVDTSHVSASRIDAEMVPKINQPKTVTAAGAVRANSARANPAGAKSAGARTTGGSSTRSIETSALALDFIPGPSSQPGGQPRYLLSHAHSLAPATVTMNDPVPGLPANQPRITHVAAQRIEADFAENNRMKRMQGHGNTQLDRDQPGHPHETSTSQEFVGDFDSQGQWTSFDQSGNVRFHQADRAGQGSRAHSDRATDTVTLYGPAEASDATSHTTADNITFNQTTDVIHAEGHVLSTYSSSSAARPADSRAPTTVAASTGPGGRPGGMGPALSLGSDLTHIVSEHLVGNSAKGHALYTGHARMWQGDSIIEADEIELDRPSRQLDARGNVKAVFLSAPSSSPDGTPGASPAKTSSTTKSSSTAKQPTTAKPASTSSRGATSIAPPTGQSGGADSKTQVWNVRTPKLTYFDNESRAHLDDGFTAESQGGSITGQNCDIFFVPAAQRVPGTSAGIDHAIAHGHVIVHQDERRGEAERADYTTATGKFVLSGGKPTIFDADGTSVTGHQLTFFQADDTILVESEEGVRTLTRHRVQK